MSKRQEVSYFGAGPAPLPTGVLEEACKALLNYNGMGIGLAEISHRSPQANQVLADAKTALRDLLEIPEDYEILFTQGGGSGQFSEVVYHMVSIWVEKQRQYCEKVWKMTNSPYATESEDVKLQELKKVIEANLRLDYLVTGSWSLKASQEAARLVGPEHVHVIADAREANGGKFGVIPSEDQWKLERPSILGAEAQTQQSAFTYYCDNETVDGVEFQGFPKSLESTSPDEDRLVVADMSSNILSRKIDVSKFSVIFGGAQKNVSCAGVTIVIIRKSLLPPQSAHASPDLLRKLGLPIGPVALDWATIAKNNSLYNTLPIFDVWIAGRVMQQLLERHGSKRVSGQEAEANAKAQKIYGVLDANPNVYQVVPDKSVRSRMNICLRIMQGAAEQEDKFLKGAKEVHLEGLKGHRSVGGIRISNYNAVSVDAADKLVAYLKQFAAHAGSGN